jgi:hypothetical protein
MSYVRSRYGVNRVEQFLNDHQIKYRLERRKRHPAIVVAHGGAEIASYYPLTPSTHNSHYRLISTIRHRLGLVGGAQQ